MRSFLEKHHRLVGFVGALAALIIAIIYLIVIPSEASGAGAIQKYILMYGHSLCWVLLSGASLLWAIQKRNKWSVFLTYAALATYGIFLGTLIITKFVSS